MSRLADVDAVVIRYDELWWSGNYYSLGGDLVASFAWDGHTMRLMQNADGRHFEMIRDRVRLNGRRSVLARHRFVLVDDQRVRLGSIAPNSTLLSSRWRLRLSSDRHDTELRARTTRSKWDENFHSRRLRFDLNADVGRATFSMGFGSESSFTVDVSDLRDEVLRLLVLTAPLCLPLAGLTGIDASGSGP